MSIETNEHEKLDQTDADYEIDEMEEEISIKIFQAKFFVDIDSGNSSIKVSQSNSSGNST